VKLALHNYFHRNRNSVRTKRTHNPNVAVFWGEAMDESCIDSVEGVLIFV
jgi:hypothetical protein